MDTHVTAGNVHDSQPYIGRLQRQIERFNLNPIAAGVDAGYFTAPVCHLAKEMSIALVPGYRRPNKGQNAYQKKHFYYDAQRDVYVCPTEALLTYSTTDRNGYKTLQIQYGSMPIMRTSTIVYSKQKGQKTITRHVWEEAKEWSNTLRLSKWGKKIYARRKETVERSFADAKQHHGHRYARFRGLNKVQMQCLLAAVAQNMKKMALLALLFYFFKLIQSQLKAYRTEYSLRKLLMMGF
ncbi:transposase [Providencia sp. PROV040]|uniref:transposase n=1 Tax=Providencia sp. PROV040 TaxID=2949771 RepID=UPI0029347B14|nr:transposase [Providencia sp. PROV040]WOB85618.1 transposase [Providencia sp. PROV040]